MPHTIRQIEDLVISALKAPPLNVYVEDSAIREYNSEFKSDEGVRKILNAFPVVFVFISSGNLNPVTTLATYMREMAVHVIVADRNLRGGATARKSATGTYQMIEDVLSILHLNSLGLGDVVGLEATRWNVVVDDPTLSAFQIDFKIRFLNQ